MGLETLIEAALFLEYKALAETNREVELLAARPRPIRNVESPTNLASLSPVQNENRFAIIPNGLHLYFDVDSPNHPSLSSPSVLPLPQVPTAINGFKGSHAYRRINESPLSPTSDLNGGTKPPNTPKLGTSNSGQRIVHNLLEKNRRATLKEAFENLKSLLPLRDQKISHLVILRCAKRHIRALLTSESQKICEVEELTQRNKELQFILNCRCWGSGSGVMSATGPLSISTGTELSRSPVAASTVENSASSPTGGQICINGTNNNSNQ